MNGRDIVMMSLQNWGESLGSNSYNLAIEFARNNRVLYVNRAPDRISQIKSILKVGNKVGYGKSISNPLKNIFVLHTKTILESINRLPHLAFIHMNRFNGKKLSEEIKDAIHELDFNSIILFIDNDFFRGLHLKEYLKPSKFIYYIRDNLRTHPYFKKHGQFCEDTIAQKADLVVANSGYLANILKPLNPNSHDVGQGCDFSLFPDKLAEKPDDFPANAKPIIGYIGNIVSYRLDLEILEKICKKRNDLNWLFIGPIDRNFEFSPINDLENVYFLGIKKESDLWKYIQHIDVCINPQRINGMTVGNYPRKIDEYLYTGKPVVATKTPFMEYFSNEVYLFSNCEEFDQQLNKALNEKSDKHLIEKRKTIAQEHTWANCVSKIYSQIKLS
jgi:teichuronic acid biosynthesis glycosyltransferase TuaH